MSKKVEEIVSHLVEVSKNDCFATKDGTYSEGVEYGVRLMITYGMKYSCFNTDFIKDLKNENDI